MDSNRLQESGILLFKIFSSKKVLQQQNLTKLCLYQLINSYSLLFISIVSFCLEPLRHKSMFLKKIELLFQMIDLGDVSHHLRIEVCQDRKRYTDTPPNCLLEDSIKTV